jgi:hypothetical protein
MIRLAERPRQDRCGRPRPVELGSLMSDESNMTILVDANVYLTLFECGKDGEKILSALEEQSSRIFVSRQTVDEVTRRKLKVAHDYFLNLPIVGDLPSHLFDTMKSSAVVKELRRAKADLRRLVDETLSKIGRSEDQVSLRLAKLFANAEDPNDDETKLAIRRRLMGNPPGVPSDPLGDQITWEQFLTRCRKTKGRVWIITTDPDFGLARDDDVILNPMLYRELKEAGVSEIHCFKKVLAAIKHFAEVTGAAAHKLPPKEQADKIDDEFVKLSDRLSARSAVIAVPGGFIWSEGRLFGGSFQVVTDTGSGTKIISPQ